MQYVGVPHGPTKGPSTPPGNHEIVLHMVVAGANTPLIVHLPVSAGFVSCSAGLVSGVTGRTSGLVGLVSINTRASGVAGAVSTITTKVSGDCASWASGVICGMVSGTTTVKASGCTTRTKVSGTELSGASCAGGRESGVVPASVFVLVVMLVAVEDMGWVSSLLGLVSVVDSSVSGWALGASG